MSQELPQHYPVGRIDQGSRKAVVSACCDGDSIWVEINRSPGRFMPWQMTPKLARDLAGLLNIAANTAQAFSHPCARATGRK